MNNYSCLNINVDEISYCVFKQYNDAQQLRNLVDEIVLSLLMK